ncbi:hypothetical protein BaRGS_00006031 [Batillaria attramentaria]|uniref:Rab3 GTPase-activating protein non-catalytic subunit n=1 Tax=Batillaria attramentaria TaxID=370345 RepID=A0ABD0LTF0_9CAEN
MGLNVDVVLYGPCLSYSGGDDWDADWGWGAEENRGDVPQSTNSTNVETVDDSVNKWLQGSIVSLSPNNDIIAVASEDRICVLTQKWDPQNKGEEIDTRLSSVWQSNITQDEGEVITDVLCLPLASQKRSTQGAPDWTCVIVGFSTGYVRMYTETGVLLLSQLLHVEPVQRLKCRTYEPPRFLGMAEQHEELIILYKRAVVSIDGFSLIQSLRGCRNQVARATASGSESFVQPPPLAYKKWALNDQDRINDLVSCGVTTSNPFDQMKNASMQGGFNATVKTSPPAATVYLTSGIGPYVGFFYAIEGSTQPILSEVAMAMAHKIKSALMSAASGWLGFGGRQKEEAKDKPPKIEPATPLPLRFGLPDKRRSGDSLILSPCNNYIATTDSFGRVILTDVQRGIAIRMWKGYRDAQIGWVQVKEDEGSHHKGDHSRIAQFLIIYAPRRGILEVWTAAHGPRVAAFNVSKNCVLVCPSYGMMGLNNVTYRGVRSRAFHCALVDPEGSVKTLDIPFHLALSDKSSKRARDTHLLKKLKATLKEATSESESLQKSVKDLFMDIRIASISHQALERILSTRYLSVGFMQEVVQACIGRLASKGEDSLDIDSRMLLRFAHTQASLLDMYAVVHKLSSQSAQLPAESSDSEMLQTTLGLSKDEATNMMRQVESFVCVRERGKSRVKFASTLLPPTSFLHCFSSRSHASEVEAGKSTATLTISREISEERRQALAHLLFHGCVSGMCRPEDIATVLQESNLAPEQLLNLLLLYWLSSDDRSLASVPSLHALVKTITAMTDTSEVLVDVNTMSPWWQRVRDACSQSEHCCAAYIAAVTCRRVAADFISSQTKAKDPDADTASDKEEDEGEKEKPVEQGGEEKLEKSADSAGWESLAVDLELWDLLVRQLEDTLALSTLLHETVPPSEQASDSAEPTYEVIKVSVSKLLDGGRGSISELVARFVASLGLGPNSLYSFQQQSPTGSGSGEGRDEEGAPSPKEEEAVDSKVTPLERFQNHMQTLRARFPHSLDNDILISNCCWEYAVLWNKDPDVVRHLQLSLEYLKLVQNAVLRQGVSSMLWHMFVMKRMSAAAQLMEKVGKPPKDRLCRKEVGMSDSSMTTFVGLVVDLLDIIMDANCEANEVPVFNIELIWQSVRGPASLGELAVDAKVTNYGLVRLHWHLGVLMHAVLVFGIRGIKVLSLFDRKGQAAVFKDLHSHPLLPSQKVEESLALSRRADFLKRHHVCELYSYGHDKLAEEVLTTVNDHELMGSQLLMVAGRRMAYRLLHENPRETMHFLGGISPRLATWLRSLEVDQLAYKDSPVKDVSILMTHVVNQLPEGYSEYNLAIELVDLVYSMSQS